MIMKYREQTEGALMNGDMKIESIKGEVSGLAAPISGTPLFFLRYSCFHARLYVLLYKKKM
jgi:hypothetical protein